MEVAGDPHPVLDQPAAHLLVPCLFQVASALLQFGDVASSALAGVAEETAAAAHPTKTRWIRPGPVSATSPMPINREELAMAAAKARRRSPVDASEYSATHAVTKIGPPS